MTHLPAWVIEKLEREEREKQTDNREQLRLPLYDDYPERPEPEPESDKPKMIVIEL